MKKRRMKGEERRMIDFIPHPSAFILRDYAAFSAGADSPAAAWAAR